MLTEHVGDGALVRLSAAAKRYAWRAPGIRVNEAQSSGLGERGASGAMDA